MIELMILAVIGLLGAGVWCFWPIDPTRIEIGAPPAPPSPPPAPAPCTDTPP
ncbi:MAG: hypothetical protein QG612_1469 [Pseudomonadota bacterium]|nr:hypothetical protein [Pseudomonadota bacterium]